MLLPHSNADRRPVPKLDFLQSASFTSLAGASAAYRHDGSTPAPQYRFHPKPTTKCEYARSRAHLPLSSHPPHDARLRRMMRGGDKHASSPPEPSTQTFNFTLPREKAPPEPFRLHVEPNSPMGLHFPLRALNRPLKRGRAAADVDGEHSCIQKKKRRLRLFLITSRLSPQFSYPATNIVDRGSSKIAVWAKQKSLGRNLLRKAAILNRVRRRASHAQHVVDGQGRVLIEQEREQRELELARLEFTHGAVDTYTRPVTIRTPSVPPTAAVRTGGRFIVSGSPSVSPESSRSSSPTRSSPPPHDQADEEMQEYHSPNAAYAYSPPRIQTARRDYLPLPPSPLGISNYDAFDTEEDIPDPYSHFDEESEEETFTTSFHHEDEDADDVPFSPSAVTSISSATLQTRVSQVLETPQSTIYADFGSLDHNEPVFGDFDQIDDGTDPVWPSDFAKEVNKPQLKSSTPNFHTLLAPSSSKRIDSFAAPSTSRPDLSSVVPSTTTSTSPNFATPVSPNFSASYSTSPNFGPTSSTSPNFSALDHPSPPTNMLLQRRHSLPAPLQSGLFTQHKESDADQERRR